jgi:hypothetical protein
MQEPIGRLGDPPDSETKGASWGLRSVCAGDLLGSDEGYSRGLCSII